MVASDNRCGYILSVPSEQAPNMTTSVTLGDLKRFVATLESSGVKDRQVVILDQEFSSLMSEVTSELLDESGYDESLAVLENIINGGGE